MLNPSPVHRHSITDRWLALQLVLAVQLLLLGLLATGIDHPPALTACAPPLGLLWTVRTLRRLHEETNHLQFRATCTIAAALGLYSLLIAICLISIAFPLV